MEGFDVPCLPECAEWLKAQREDRPHDPNIWKWECQFVRSNRVMVAGITKCWNVRTCHFVAADCGSSGKRIVRDAFRVAIEFVTGMFAVQFDEILAIRNRFLEKHGIADYEKPGSFDLIKAYDGQVKNGSLYIVRENLRAWTMDKFHRCEVCEKLVPRIGGFWGMDLRLTKFSGMACPSCRDRLVQSARRTKEWQLDQRQKLKTARKQLQQFNKLLKGEATHEALK